MIRNIFHRSYGIACIVIIALVSCDPTPPPPNECDSFGGCGIGMPIYYYDPGQIDYINPVFNPINSNELIALRIIRSDDTIPEEINLEKFNYVTQTREVILSNQFLIDNNLNICGFDWSPAGWIVIHDCNSNQIFKVQDDGSSFQQISFGAAGFYACYSSDGNSIYYSDYTKGFLMDANTGSIHDTILGSFNFPTFSNDGRVLCSGSDNMIRVIDTSSMAITNMFLTNPSIANIMQIEPIALNSNEVIVNSGYSGIYKLNLTTHSVFLLKSACANRMISGISVSPDGTKIVYQLTSYYVPSDPCYILNKSTFRIMNIDGSNDQALVMP